MQLRDDVQRVREAARQLVEAVEALHPEIDYAPQWAIADVRYERETAFEELSTALQMLEDDQPLASHFRDGDLARPPFTARTVIALAKQAGWKDPLTHRDEEYQRILDEVRSELGRRHRVPCAGRTAAGRQCKSFALAYGLVEDSRAGCHSHATAAEKAHNKRMQEREERVFHERLKQAGIDQ